MGISEVRHMIEEGRRYEAAGNHDRALQRYRAAEEAAEDPAARSEAIRRQSDVHRTRSEWSEATESAEQAERVASAHGLDDLVAEAINAKGAVFHNRGELDEAEPYYNRAIEMAKHPRVSGIVMQNLGTLAAQRGDLETASTRFKEAYDSCKEGGYERGMLFALMNYARSMFEQGNNETAERLLKEAEVLAISMMDLDISHLAALNRAEAMIQRGAYEEAETLVSSALGYYGNSGNPYRRLEALRLLGDITVKRGPRDQARIFYQAAADLAEKIEAGQEIDVLRSRLANLDEI
ncbi:MAG: tetratricopeptide repeat protein [Longimicrobiales bacterium]